MPDEQTRLVHASGDCEIDLARRELRVSGSFVPVGGRAFQIIEVLAGSAGELVTKDQLLDRIWPGAIVGENTLHVHAGAIRRALGPYRNLLKTESGRGYRLLGDWTVRHQETAKPPVGLQRMRTGGESPVTNFPVPVTRLIGRTAAVTQLRDLVSAYRVVTLAGPGGIGKTSLAVKVAHGIVGEFADGGWLVELASLSDPSLVPTAVAGALRLFLGPTDVTPEAVAHGVADKKLLLVLDNCEHLIEAVATLAETLLARCPNVTILATSREILRILGEHVYRVPALEVPAIEHIDAARILDHSAVELFVTRAREQGADFASDCQYQATIAMICRQLDGIPLAIEFAAARAAVLGLQPVARGLRDRFALLTSGRRTALPRHRTLRATLDWSYQLLTEAERDLLRRLAIFVGPFSLAAACAVTDDAMAAGEIADGIADLISKSLVFKTAPVTEPEYRLLETTRAYAFDRLTESGALTVVAARHAEYSRRLLGGIEEEQRATPPDEYLATLRRRADEIHAALDWAFSPAGDPALGMALTIAAVPLWFELSRMGVAHGRAEQSLRHAEPGSEQLMWLLLAQGHALWYLEPGSEAMEPAFAGALEIAERIGATTVRTRALWGMWAVRRARGDYTAALQMAERYADAAAGDTGAMHLADRILGLTHHALGDQPVARHFTERALRQPHLLNPTSGLGYQVETPVAMPAQLGRVLWLMGFPDRAMQAARQAVAAARDGGRAFPICYAVGFGGLPVALWNDAVEEARSQLDLLAAHAESNQRWEQWRICFDFVLRLRAGDAAGALIAAYIESCWDPIAVPPFADLPLDAVIPVPSPREASAGTLWNAPEVLRVDAELLLWHDAPLGAAAAAAEAKLRLALETARAQSALSWELRAAMGLARLWRPRRRADARDLLAGTYAKFTEGFATGDLIRARRLLEELEPAQSPG